MRPPVNDAGVNVGIKPPWRRRPVCGAVYDTGVESTEVVRARTVSSRHGAAAAAFSVFFLRCFRGALSPSLFRPAAAAAFFYRPALI